MSAYSNNLSSSGNNENDANFIENLLQLGNQQYPLLMIDRYKSRINEILEEYQESESQDSELMELLGSSNNEVEEYAEMSPEVINALELSLILLDKISKERVRNNLGMLSS